MGVKNLDISQNSSKISEKLKEKFQEFGILLLPTCRKNGPKKPLLLQLFLVLGILQTVVDVKHNKQD